MFSFHIKFVQTDRRTAVKQYDPDLSIRGGGGGGGGGGHKNLQITKQTLDK